MRLHLSIRDLKRILMMSKFIKSFSFLMISQIIFLIKKTSLIDRLLYSWDYLQLTKTIYELFNNYLKMLTRILLFLLSL